MVAVYREQRHQKQVEGSRGRHRDSFDLLRWRKEASHERAEGCSQKAGTIGKMRYLIEEGAQLHTALEAVCVCYGQSSWSRSSSEGGFPTLGRLCDSGDCRRLADGT